MQLLHRKSKPKRQDIKKLRSKPGYHQFTRKFAGKKFKYWAFIPDPQHQGQPGRIEQVRAAARRDKYKIRTVRRPTGWEVYHRMGFPWPLR